MPKSKVIELSGQKYSAEWLRAVPLDKAVSVLRSKHDKNQVINAWKQSNGLSIRDYAKKEVVTKKSTTKSTKKATANKNAEK